MAVESDRIVRDGLVVFIMAARAVDVVVLIFGFRSIARRDGFDGAVCKATSTADSEVSGAAFSLGRVADADLSRSVCVGEREIHQLSLLPKERFGYK